MRRNRLIVLCAATLLPWMAAARPALADAAHKPMIGPECEAMADEAGNFVGETFEALDGGEGRITVTQYADEACAEARQAFRATGRVTESTHTMPDGSRRVVRGLAIARMEIVGWAADVLAALNGGEAGAACGARFSRGQFVAVSKSACLNTGFFARDAAKFVRLAVGNHFFFK